jgi:RHS repeat-associated protein
MEWCPGGSGPGNPGAPVQTRHIYSALTLDTPATAARCESRCDSRALPERPRQGLNTVAEYISCDDGENWDLGREFLWGNRFPEPLAMIDYTAAGEVGPDSEEVLHYVHDALGSVVGLLDAGQPDAQPPVPPKMVERYDYDPYGKTYIDVWDGGSETWVRTAASAYGNPFAWTGQRYDAGVGMYHFLFRCYSPELGRWMQRDPLGYVDGVNAYEYAGASALSARDPLGLANDWGLPGYGLPSDWSGGTLYTPGHAPGNPLPPNLIYFGGNWFDQANWALSKDASFWSVYDMGRGETRRQADEAADRAMRETGDKQIQDTMRHAMWQVLGTIRNGLDNASIIGDSHEAFQAWGDRESAKDRYNNAIAQAIGQFIRENEEFTREWNALYEWLMLEIDFGLFVVRPDDPRLDAFIRGELTYQELRDSVLRELREEKERRHRQSEKVRQAPKSADPCAPVM